MRDKDLNLLKVFALLLDECNLTRAAARLGLTQPALSRNLARLRQEFDDPLFVRAPGGLIPTSKALTLEKPLRAALDRIETLYASPSEFAPTKATGTVRIATTDYFEQIIWVDLLGKLSRTAPKMTFVTQMTGSELPMEALRRGDVHLAIAGFFQDLAPGLMRQKLFSDRLVTITRKNHPQLKTKLTLEIFLKLNHLIVSPRGNLDSIVDTVLHAAGRKRHIAASVCSFLSSGPIVAASDLILTAPAKLVRRFAESQQLATHEPPIELPPIDIIQVWHERFHNDSMHQWLRSEISNAVNQP